MSGHLLKARVRNTAPARHIPEEGHDVVLPFRSAEPGKQYRVVASSYRHESTSDNSVSSIRRPV